MLFPGDSYQSIVKLEHCLEDSFRSIQILNWFEDSLLSLLDSGRFFEILFQIYGGIYNSSFSALLCKSAPYVVIQCNSKCYNHWDNLIITEQVDVTVVNKEKLVNRLGSPLRLNQLIIALRTCASVLISYLHVK